LRNAVELKDTVTRSVRACPIGYVLALVAACSGSAGCKASRSPIFEWEPPATVAGVSGSGGAGASGENVAVGGQPAPEAGSSGSGMQGQSGSTPPVDDGVKFEWKQKLPGEMCTGANFVGSVSCPLTSGGIQGPRLDGTLLLDLVGPSESQELKAESGSLNLILDPTGSVVLMSPANGTASCMTKTFNGAVPERTFTSDETGLAFQLVLLTLCGAGTSSLSASIVGSLDADGRLRGTLALTIGTCICEGPFVLRPQL
jgi:hypothetical protein